MPQQQQQGVKQNLGTCIAIAQIIALPMQLYLRVLGSAGAKRFGGFHMVVAMTVLLIYATLIVPYAPEAMLFFLMTLGMLLLHRLKRAWKRPRVHSRYVGDSGLSFLGGDLLAKKLWEPLVVLLAAYIAGTYGSPLAGWFGFSAVCLLVSTWVAVLADKAQDQALIDAQAERELMVSKMREM